MPVVQINMLEGRTSAQKNAMYSKVSRAISETLGVPVERIRIIVQEVPKENWCIGDKSARDLGR